MFCTCVPSPTGLEGLSSTTSSPTPPGKERVPTSALGGLRARLCHSAVPDTRPLDRKLPGGVSLGVLQFLHPRSQLLAHRSTRCLKRVAGGLHVAGPTARSVHSSGGQAPQPFPSKTDVFAHPRPGLTRDACHAEAGERAATQLQGLDEPPALHAKASELPWPSSLRLSQIPAQLKCFAHLFFNPMRPALPCVGERASPSLHSTQTKENVQGFADDED